MSNLYVDLRFATVDSSWDLNRFAVPTSAFTHGEAWRVICPCPPGEEAVSLIGFPRKRDAECAKAALERAGCVDEQTLAAVPFQERVRLMIESLQW